MSTQQSLFIEKEPQVLSPTFSKCKELSTSQEWHSVSVEGAAGRVGMLFVISHQRTAWLIQMDLKITDHSPSSLPSIKKLVPAAYTYNGTSRDDCSLSQRRPYALTQDSYRQHLTPWKEWPWDIVLRDITLSSAGLDAAKPPQPILSPQGWELRAIACSSSRVVLQCNFFFWAAWEICE